MLEDIKKFGQRLWARATGSVDEMITQDASTPEGAKAYYNAAIEAKSDQYEKAVNTLHQMNGKIVTYEQQLRDCKKAKMQYDLDLKKYIDSGDDEAAMLCLKKQTEIDDQVQILKQSVPELKANAELQQEVVNNLRDKIEALKSEKNRTVLELETAQSIKALKVDSYAATTEEEKMLEKVRDGVQKSKEAATGHKIAYENSTSVQQKRLDQRMKEADMKAKLQELKNAAKK